MREEEEGCAGGGGGGGRDDEAGVGDGRERHRTTAWMALEFGSKNDSR